MKKSVKHKFQYLLFFLLSMPAFIFASAQDIRVNIDFTKASLGSVLNEIGRQTSLSIVYNTGDVNPTQPVSIKASNENITTVMNRLLRGTGLSYSIMNNILFFRPLIRTIRFNRRKLRLQEIFRMPKANH